jgi:hypothetical protein
MVPAITERDLLNYEDEQVKVQMEPSYILSITFVVFAVTHFLFFFVWLIDCAIMMFMVKQ